MNRARTYPISAAIMLALDLLWLGVISPPLYQGQVGQLLRPEPLLLPAALFYMIYLVGVNEFVIHAMSLNASLAQVLGRGALFGVVAYATFDLTAMAMLAGWTPLVTVVDIAWGALLTATVAALTVAFARRR